MTPQEYVARDALGLAALVRNGEVTPSELIECAAQIIAQHNPTLNAVVMLDTDRARELAADTGRRPPFHGVPFLAKDNNVDIENFPTTCSSRYFAAAEAGADSELVRRWRAAGLLILGRTNLPEFAADFVTESRFRGICRNPWNTGYSPGGSSGGAAAAVASGMVPMAHGNDLGGSIRIPAAACGLVGLKPTRGRVPLGPAHGEIASGLDCEHVLTRTVRDCAAALDATAQPDPGAPYWTALPQRSFLASIGTPPGTLRIACAIDSPAGVAPHSHCRAAVVSTARLLEDMGHQVTEYRLPSAFAHLDVTLPIWMAGIAEEIAARARAIGRDPKPDELEPLTWHCVDIARRHSMLDYLGMKRGWNGIARLMAAEFQNFDVLVTPTTALPALPIGAHPASSPGFDFERWSAVGYGYAPYSEVFNLTGYPALSLPLAVADHGLQVGVQFVASFGADALLLQLARQIEIAHPWHGRRPPIWG